MVFRDCNVGLLYRNGDRACRNDAYRYMLRHFARVTARTNFRCHVDLETMVCLLNNPAIQALPHQRLEGALAWVRFHPRERSQYLDTLLAQLPGALIAKQTLKGLLRDPVVTCLQRNIIAVNDLMKSQSQPYYESGTLHALGLTELRESGGKKTFAFITADDAAEFEVVVDASPCMTHFKFSLNCSRVAMPESCNRLPDCVRADMKVELCAQDGCSTEMVTVNCGVSEENYVTLVSEARKVQWSRRFQLDQCQMKQFVANGSKFSLFVHLKALEVNGRREEFDPAEESEDEEGTPEHVCALQAHACTFHRNCYSRSYHCVNTAAPSVPTCHVRKCNRSHSCRRNTHYCNRGRDRCWTAYH